MTKKEQQFIDEIKRVRGIDFARLGMMVEIGGKVGTIVGLNSSGNLDVVFSNRLQHGKGKRNCHPTYNIAYFDKDGKIIKDFRAGS